MNPAAGVKHAVDVLAECQAQVLRTLAEHLERDRRHRRGLVVLLECAAGLADKDVERLDVAGAVPVGLLVLAITAAYSVWYAFGTFVTEPG